MAKKQGALGIIGGSGLYEIAGLEDTRWEAIATPFGEPSDEFFFGRLAGRDLVFLPRHGRGHRLPPGDINYRANIDAMKRAGVTESFLYLLFCNLITHLRRSDETRTAELSERPVRQRTIPT